MQLPGTRILIFARSPAPGAVKTRLIPALGAEGAARLHAACVRHLLSRLQGVGGLTLCVTPDIAHPLWHELRDLHDCGLSAQVDGDLGRRMHQAARAALAVAGRVILVGTDVPLLDRDYVLRAARALDAGADVVMGPAEDGGYVLLGLKRDHPSLFEGMPWGGGQVADRTREACARDGLALTELETLWDLDRPEDLTRLRAPGLEALWQLYESHLLGRFCAGG